jgi:hypothetical protein
MILFYGSFLSIPRHLRNEVDHTKKGEKTETGRSGQSEPGGKWQQTIKLE